MMLVVAAEWVAFLLLIEQVLCLSGPRDLPESLCCSLTHSLTPVKCCDSTLNYARKPFISIPVHSPLFLFTLFY